MRDAQNFCSAPGTDNCEIEKTLGNLQKHAFELITKGSALIDVIKKTEENLTYGGIYDTMETIGENIGAIVGSLIDYK